MRTIAPYLCAAALLLSPAFGCSDEPEDVEVEDTEGGEFGDPELTGDEVMGPEVGEDAVGDDLSDDMGGGEIDDDMGID